MTAPTQESQAQAPQQSDKELNFRKQEAMYQRQLEQARAAQEELQRQLNEVMTAQRQRPQEDEEEDEQPYVDQKKLNKTLQKFGQQTQSEIQKAIEEAKRAAKEEIKRETWLESNPDFYDILQHANTFADKAPALAKSILAMPEGFERQKLVYENIKTLGLHKPPVQQSTIQEKVDANRRSPYYQPSGIGTAPYGQTAVGKEYSPVEQKNAYQKMQELKNKLRI